MTNEAVLLVISEIIRSDQVTDEFKERVLDDIIRDTKDRQDYLSVTALPLAKAMRDIVLGTPNETILDVMLFAPDAESATAIHTAMYDKTLPELASLLALLVRKSSGSDVAFASYVDEAYAYLSEGKA